MPLPQDGVPLPGADEGGALPVPEGCPLLQVQYAGRSGMANETADKMDTLMLVFFEHLWRATHREGEQGNSLMKLCDSCVNSSGDLDMEQASQVFGDMQQVRAVPAVRAGPVTSCD